MTGVAWCEIGPVVVRRLGDGVSTSDRALAAAVLEAGADPLAIVGDRVVRTEAAWRQVLGSLLVDVGEVRLIHPTWWPPTQVAMLARSAAGVTTVVQTFARSAMTTPGACGAVVIEIAPHVVILVRDGEVIVGQTRSAPTEDVADRVVQQVLAAGAPSASVDAPAEVPGAVELAIDISKRLLAKGLRVDRVDPRQWMPPAQDPPEPERTRPRASARGMTVVVIGAALAGAVGLWSLAWRGEHPPPGRDEAGVPLHEGKVTVQIPEGWMVRRVTTGPGSRRVEVISPGARAALHLTQAPVVVDDLADIADTLRAAVDSQPSGVFVEFNPADERAGRPAVTYREVREDHEIRWTVLLDNGIRIGIGCQSRLGAEPEIEPACERAVASARTLR